MASIKFWDGLVKKETFNDQDKLLVGNNTSNGVNYSDMSDLKTYITEDLDTEGNAPQTDTEVFD